ncbi:T3SS effector HopA1 family protein [Nocardiopsis sp. RSe5-2]|uniref:T3SS effector HopA1 family protein n=1 Tax=Nocardiopsis endophytica TaxID=3018445 RepID=A0ABT4U6G7_9ACTN|nr:T3SS effector HopA1 family protein [Nocardiopsis endophytica]MDA2812536.1 T3SS effector HopA1 family protein [Nocardiopsis endophytica]
MTASPVPAPAGAAFPDPATLRTWCDRVRAVVAPESAAAPAGRWLRAATGDVSEPAAHPRGVPTLRSWLYRDVHLAGLHSETATPDADAAAAALFAELATGTWRDPGWTVEGEAPGDGGPGTAPDAVVSKNGVRLRAAPEELHVGADGGTAEVLLPRARPGALFGWFGYTGPVGPPVRPKARLYLHPPSLADRGVIGPLLEALERLEAPWQAKAATRGAGAPRPDSFVVYLRAADAGRVAAELASSGLPEVLADPVPGFALRIAQGVGLAVHPPGLPGGSFGVRLADLFARTLVEHGTDGLEERIGAALHPAPEAPAAEAGLPESERPEERSEVRVP